MPASELAETGTYVREIFEKAGVEIVWLDSMSRVGAQEPDSLNHGWAEGSGRHVSLAIVTRPGAVGPKGRNTESVLGWTPSGQRSRTYVFYERVEALVLNSFPRVSLRVPRVLAYAVAHELGHLLIPLANAHSEKGIMKAQLDRNDLAELFSGSLGFSGKESELIVRDLKPRPDFQALAR